MGKSKADAREQRSIADRPLLLFAVLFSAIFLLHAPLLRLPYFWDEAGYFVPAARDLLLTGDPIPHTTLSNAHPPLVMAWLAMWWKFSNYTPAVTRTAMLLLSAFALLGVFRLARRVANTSVATGATVLTAIYPVFFAQSSLAQLDIAVAALTIWGVAMHVEGRPVARTVFLALAPLAKETAIVTPLALFGWEILCRVLPAARDKQWCMARGSILQTYSFLLCGVPLAAWYGYHYLSTGFLFGNPEYLRYNVTATLSALRIAIAFVQRLWQAFGYMNLFVLTAAMLLAMRLPPLVDEAGERKRIAIPVQLMFGVLVLAHAVEYAVLGGAVLARYMLPVIPLVIIVAVSTLYRRVRKWPVWVAVVAVAFVLALVVNPPWRIAPEDNLAYSDFVRLHKEAAVLIERKYTDDKILTAWPGSDELNRPFLGYVTRPLTVVRVENFTAQQVIAAARQRESFDVAFVFSTKYEPARNFFNRFEWWNRIQERYFDYHRDLPPELIAQMLGGRIVWQQNRGGQWAAVIELDKIRNAELEKYKLQSPSRRPSL